MKRDWAMNEILDAIMIHMPNAFFKEEGYPRLKMASFRRFYETMGTADGDDDRCFHHFIGQIPRQPVSRVFVCFHGFVQYRAFVVEFIRNKPLILPGYSHPRPRNWMVTTGPVEKAPEGMIQKGFRGFRYTKNLF